MKQIKVIVSPTGEVEIQTKGYTGNSCQKGSRFLEEALGVSTAEVKTPEFYAKEAPKLTQEG